MRKLLRKARRSKGAAGGARRQRPRNMQIADLAMVVAKRTYESLGGDLEIQRLRGSRMINFAWSNESDRVVLINTRLNEAECTFFQVKGNTFQPLFDESNKLNSLKIVALTFAGYTPRHRSSVIGRGASTPQRKFHRRG